MRYDEVPQEQNKTLAGNKKAVYATDKDGAYNTVASEGWEVEEIVTSQAVEEFERLAQEALTRTHAGEASVLEYHMYRNRMDLALLSQTTGFFKWTIKKDFKINKFQNISENRAKIYADVLCITVDELKSTPKN